MASSRLILWAASCLRMEEKAVIAFFGMVGGFIAENEGNAELKIALP